MPAPNDIVQLFSDLASINARRVSGVRDIRDGVRSTTFDLAALADERTLVEAKIRAAGYDPVTGALAVKPMVRRLLMTQHHKGL